MTCSSGLCPVAARLWLLPILAPFQPIDSLGFYCSHQTARRYEARSGLCAKDVQTCGRLGNLPSPRSVRPSSSLSTHLSVPGTLRCSLGNCKVDVKTRPKEANGPVTLPVQTLLRARWRCTASWELVLLVLPVQLVLTAIASFTQ